MQRLCSFCMQRRCEHLCIFRPILFPRLKKTPKEPKVSCHLLSTWHASQNEYNKANKATPGVVCFYTCQPLLFWFSQQPLVWESLPWPTGFHLVHLNAFKGNKYVTTLANCCRGFDLEDLFVFRIEKHNFFALLTCAWILISKQQDKAPWFRAGKAKYFQDEDGRWECTPGFAESTQYSN